MRRLHERAGRAHGGGRLGQQPPQTGRGGVELDRRPLQLGGAPVHGRVGQRGRVTARALGRRLDLGARTDDQEVAGEGGRRLQSTPKPFRGGAVGDLGDHERIAAGRRQREGELAADPRPHVVRGPQGAFLERAQRGEAADELPHLVAGLGAHPQRGVRRREPRGSGLRVVAADEQAGDDRGNGHDR